MDSSAIRPQDDRGEIEMKRLSALYAFLMLVFLIVGCGDLTPVEENKEVSFTIANSPVANNQPQSLQIVVDPLVSKDSNEFKVLVYRLDSDGDKETIGLNQGFLGLQKTFDRPNFSVDLPALRPGNYEVDILISYTRQNIQLPNKPLFQEIKVSAENYKFPVYEIKVPADTTAGDNFNLRVSRTLNMPGSYVIWQIDGNEQKGEMAQISFADKESHVVQAVLWDSFGPYETIEQKVQVVNDKIVLVGPQGPAGKDGVNGKDGLNGKDGTNGVDGIDGKDGKNGTNGINGKDGKDGKDVDPATLQKILDRIKNLEDNVDLLNLQISEKGTDIRNLEISIQSLEKSKTELQNQVRELQNQAKNFATKTELSTAKKALEASILSAQKQADLAIAELEIQKTKLASAQDELNTLKAEFTSQQAEIDSLKASQAANFAIVQGKLDALDKVQQAQKKSLESLTANQDLLEKRLKLLEAKIPELKAIQDATIAAKDAAVVASVSATQAKNLTEEYANQARKLADQVRADKNATESAKTQVLAAQATVEILAKQAEDQFAKAKESQAEMLSLQQQAEAIQLKIEAIQLEIEASQKCVAADKVQVEAWRLEIQTLKNATDANVMLAQQAKLDAERARNEAQSAQKRAEDAALRAEEAAKKCVSCQTYVPSAVVTPVIPSPVVVPVDDAIIRNVSLSLEKENPDLRPATVYGTVGETKSLIVRIEGSCNKLNINGLTFNSSALTLLSATSADNAVNVWLSGNNLEVQDNRSLFEKRSIVILTFRLNKNGSWPVEFPDWGNIVATYNTQSGAKRSLINNTSPGEVIVR